jgi:hypothetical protein
MPAVQLQPPLHFALASPKKQQHIDGLSYLQQAIHNRQPLLMFTHVRQALA